MMLRLNSVEMLDNRHARTGSHKDCRKRDAIRVNIEAILDEMRAS